MFSLFQSKDTLDNIKVYEEEKQSVVTEAFFAGMSFDIWTHLFSYIPYDNFFQLRFVCSQWNAMIICNPFVWRQLFIDQILLNTFPQSSDHIMNLVESKFEQEYYILQQKHSLQQEEACGDVIKRVEKFWNEQNVLASKNYFISHLELLRWDPCEGVYFMIPIKPGLLFEHTYLRYQYVLRRYCGSPLPVHFVSKNKEQQLCQEKKFSLWYTLFLYLKSPSVEGMEHTFSKLIQNCQQIASPKSSTPDLTTQYFHTLFSLEGNTRTHNLYAQEWLYSFDRMVYWMLVLSNHCRAIRCEDNVDIIQRLFQLLSLRKAGTHVESYYGVDSGFHTTIYSPSKFGTLKNSHVSMIPKTTFNAFGNRFTIHYPINVQQFKSKYNFKEVVGYDMVRSVERMRTIFYSTTLENDNYTISTLCDNVALMDRTNLACLVQQNEKYSSYKALSEKLQHAAQNNTPFTCSLHGLHQLRITHTSIGCIYKLENRVDGTIIDLSDYDSW